MNIPWRLRRTVTLRPIVTTKAQETRLYRIYARVLAEWSAGVPAILDRYAATLSATVTDSVGDIEVQIAQTEQGALSAIFNFRFWFGEWLGSIVQWHTQQFVSRLKYATNVDLTSIIGPTPQDTMEAIIARNVALVRNVSDQTRDKIADAVYRGLTQRTPVRDVAKEISGIIGGQRARARRIASDQLVKISSAMDTSRANEIGLYEWEWQHSGKLHFRPIHKARDGEIYDDRKLPADVKQDQPGFAPFCFPSWEPIRIYDDVLMLWRRRYRGHLAHLVTGKGVSISCTPNHPILTRDGWKSAHAVNVGDYLVNVVPNGVHAFYGNVKETETSIGDVFEALEAVLGFVSINGSGGQFHGDGADEIIDVIDANGGLRQSLEALFDQEIIKLCLEKSLVMVHELLGCRPLEAFAHTGVTPGPGAMSRLHLLLSLIMGHASPNKMGGDALIAEINAIFVKHLGERVTANANTVAYRFKAFPIDVAFRCGLCIVLVGLLFRLIDSMKSDAFAPLSAIDDTALADAARLAYVEHAHSAFDISYDRVEDVFLNEWEGQVYNLQTSTGWYAIANLAVHNCGCKKRYRISGD